RGRGARPRPGRRSEGTSGASRRLTLVATNTTVHRLCVREGGGAAVGSASDRRPTPGGTPHAVLAGPTVGPRARVRQRLPGAGPAPAPPCALRLHRRRRLGGEHPGGQRRGPGAHPAPAAGHARRV